MTGSAFHVCACMLSCFSRVQLCSTLWTVAHQTLLSMGFSRQEYWSRLPFPPPGDFPDPGIKAGSLTFPALASRFFTTSATWEAQDCRGNVKREEVPGVVMYTMGGCQGKLLFKKEEKQVAKLCSFIQEIFTERIPWQSSG